VRAVGDARPHHCLPVTHGDRRAPLGEAIFARAIEELLERLGGVELSPTLSLRRS